MKKTYTIYGIQSIHHSTEVEANSEKEALKLADENHANYDWDECYIGDWDYELDNYDKLTEGLNDE